MTRPLRIYVAGPIDGSGNRTANLRRALEVADVFMAFGMHPFVPHFGVMWDLITNPKRPVREWQAWDNNWIAACDALYRLAGVSPGSDSEVRLATELWLPCFLEGSSYHSKGVTFDALGALIRWSGGDPCDEHSGAELRKLRAV